jgi:hypothetical protein
VIEPTDEMIDAFRAAFNQAATDRAASGASFIEGSEITRAGLAAVLAIVERDYEVLPRPLGARGITNPCLCGADLGPPWDSIPHRRGTRGCRSAS